ncbi:inositol monophosphatase family protein [Sphingomonas quercus]|uniref:Inositol monophosphatase n=1 Tax=Sphingomonas quercus TaxID=2842451 RepID=A0ABS6BKG5_9SPHN|nr:inositol monophosphatase family protein [Sphingomonas quercus]MBU3078342.1 inositol monophosphatase [Sphingomonas quercus]
MHRLYEPVAALMRETARDVILPRFRALAADEMEEKTPGDFVTIADRESEARLSEGLVAILSGTRVLGEEATAADPALLEGLGSGAIWIVDPVDGTNNFAEGKTPFAVMIALAVDGLVEAGWILDPVTGRLCHAARGQGAFVDGERISARSTGETLPLAAIALHFLSEEKRANLVRRAEGRLNLVAIPRCAGEQYPRLALGQNDVALFERANPWDHAPGGLFLEEAGGRLARLDGSDYRIDRPGPGLLGAASPEMWERAAEILVR